MVEETAEQRPRMAEGTTDWEVVFEDPRTGFIALIAQAHSPGALRDCATLVILKLFPRRDDLHEVEHFAAELAEIIPEGATEERMEELRDGVTVLLREIKDERIRLAAEYVARKKKGEGRGKERRGARPKRRAKGKPPSRARAWAGWTAAAVVAVAVAAFLVSLSERPVELAPASELVAQMELAAKSGNAPRRHVYGGVLKRRMIGGNVAITAMEVPQKPCVNAAWFLASTGRVMIAGSMPARITAPILAALCARAGETGDGAGNPTGGKPSAKTGATLTWYPMKADN